MKYSKQIEEFKEHLFLTSALSVYNCDFEDADISIAKFEATVRCNFPSTVNHLKSLIRSNKELSEVTLAEFFEQVKAHVGFDTGNRFTLGNIVALHKAATRMPQIRIKR